MKRVPTERDRIKEELLQTVSEIREAEKRFSLVDDPDLIDSAIYELNALNAKFNALLRKAKLAEAAAAVAAGISQAEPIRMAEPDDGAVAAV